MLAVLVDHLTTPAVLAVASHYVLRLLPLVSDRANKRAVRLAKAKKQSN